MQRNTNIFKGLAAGLVAGIAATLVMDQFQKLLARGAQVAATANKRSQGYSLAQIEAERNLAQQEQQQEEGSTDKVARVATHAATGHVLQGQQKKLGGNLVHYTFGTTMGIVYGAIAEYLPRSTFAGGTAFGTVLFLAADELAVPALRLAPPPTQTAAADQLQHWAMHIVYGGTAEMVRGTLRKLWH